MSYHDLVTLFTTNAGSSNCFHFCRCTYIQPTASNIRCCFSFAIKLNNLICMPTQDIGIDPTFYHRLKAISTVQ
uniref:Uncharacterized protein n=1 Tax=Arundo donax TaxID=35708 RepID=A0A0A9GXN2_ARUDO